MTIQQSSPTTFFSRLQSAIQARLVWTIAASAILSLGLTGTSAWNVWQIYQGLQTTIAKQFQLQEESNNIIYLGQTLGTAARMAASTGDLAWEKRYNDNIPPLDAAIAAVLKDLPKEQKLNPEQTDAANKKLVDIETKIFQLVHQGKAPEALKLVLGDEYTQQEKIYAEGIKGTLQHVKENVQQEIKSYQDNLLLSVILALSSLTVLALTWSIVLLAVRGYIRDRQAAQLSLTDSQTDLLQLNQQLAGEVEIRSQQEQQIRSESDLLQIDIAHILDIVCAIEEGDLTVQAEVNERATGLVSDTLNRTIESLDRIFSAVVNTTRTVTDDASQLELMALETARQAQFQTDEVRSVQSLMDRVNASISESLEYGVATEAAVHSATSAVSEGQQAIEDTIGGIDILRTGTAQIVKRTELLTEFVDLAAQFSKDQKRVASLTRVLALNASTLSSRAVKEQDPEQFASLAREFETIARQVNDLATDTNHSLVSLQQRTDRIQTVTSGLSQDITDIDRLVQEFTTEIGKSGRAFSNIQTAIAQASALDEKVSESNQNIVQVVNDTLRAVQSIAAVAQVTEAKATLTREQVQSMGDLSRRLLHMVEFFKLNTPTTSIPQIAAAPSPSENPASSQLVSV
jgi:methyl-accepting chemotaxis protein PixJ